MRIVSLRVELRALCHAINELCNAIQKQSEAAHPAQEAHDQDNAIPKSIPVTVSYDQQANEDQNRHYGTQEGIRKWTKRAVIAASIYAAIAGLQWYEIRNATIAATRAADTASSQLELSERPWVYGEISLNGPLTFNEQGATIPLMIVLKNSGNSPALKTSIYAVPVIGYRQNGMSLNVARDGACDTAAKMADILGVAIFPNTTLGKPLLVAISEKQIQDSIDDWGRRYPSQPAKYIVSPEVIVCISYRPAFSKTALYSTAYAMTLSSLDSQGRPGALFSPGQSIEQKSLVLGLDAITPITAK